MSARVAGIVIAPVKALRAIALEEVELGAWGVRENRRFFLIDADGRMVNGKRIAAMQAVTAEYRDAERTLCLRFPDGTVLEGAVENGARVAARFPSSTVAAVEVLGAWTDALSTHAGEALRLVESLADWGAVDRGREGGVSLISSASIERVARAEQPPRAFDPRRFRMLFEIDGTAAHEEDEWIGRPLRIGDALVMARGHVGRCLVTQLDPDSGVRDRDTLDWLASYRRDAATSEPLACGIYGIVLEPGRVRLGDAVEPA